MQRKSGSYREFLKWKTFTMEHKCLRFLSRAVSFVNVTVIEAITYDQKAISRLQQ